MTAESTAIAVRTESGVQIPSGAGTLALALMSEAEFEARLDALKAGRARVVRVQKALMTEGTDWGIIPGTEKPTLYKSGAEILLQSYGLRPDAHVERRDVGDGILAPQLSYTVRTELHEGSLDGPIVAVGLGSANSWEKRYRWRRGGRLCPECGKAGLVKTRKNQWWHPLDAKPDGGCNANFPLDDPSVSSQAVGDVENPDPYDLDNTLLKISHKRSLVAACLIGTAASAIFTQDLEEQDEDDRPARHPAAQASRHVTLTGSVVIEQGDFEPRQYPQGWAILFHIAVEDEITRVIVTHTDKEALPRFDDGATVRVDGEWQPKQGAVVASSASLVSEPTDDIDIMGGSDEEAGH